MPDEKLIQINTEQWSNLYRNKVVNVDAEKILITNFHGTDQEADLSQPANCGGYGRVHHFRYDENSAWLPNPLPTAPMCKALNLPPTTELQAQVFQLAACNWRCWYCYVPFNLLSANPRSSAWLSSGELIDMYLQDAKQPLMIDLSGGQPDLAPEWVPWMMDELIARGLDKTTYLWSDDNLSNDYFWKFLRSDQIRLIQNYKNYGRVCCFKGFNEESFAFNTMADKSLFNRQFDLFAKLLSLGIDLYAYVTITTPQTEGIEGDISEFMDRLQAIHRFLPLRTIPLEIRNFKTVANRLKHLERGKALDNQWIAISAWKHEMLARFTQQQRSVNISDVIMS